MSASGCAGSYYEDGLVLALAACWDGIQSDDRLADCILASCMSCLSTVNTPKIQDWSGQ